MGRKVGDVVRIINAIMDGDKGAADELLPVVYEELSRLAAERGSREAPGQRVQAGALVHEAYERLVGKEDKSPEERGHFFSAAAEAMRRIVVDNARRRKSEERGGGRSRIAIIDVDLPVRGPSDDIASLDESLTMLGEQDAPAYEAMKLYYFADLTLKEVAAVQRVPRLTVSRRLISGRARLNRKLRKQEEDQ